MHVVNMNSHPVQVKLRTDLGAVDFMHVMPKRQVPVPDGFQVDANWLAGNTFVKVLDTSPVPNPVTVGAA